MAITIIIWAFSNLAGGRYEYGGKIIAWYFLMFSFALFFSRLYYSAYPPYYITYLPFAVDISIILVSLMLTLPILRHLKGDMIVNCYQFSIGALVTATVFVIIIRILYFLGIVIPFIT